ncbi:MAG: type II toxin-antitoxin system VapC family toxin [Nitrospirota bacterium]
MSTVVLDASVIIKWIFPDRPEEAHSHLALQILQHIKEARLAVIQPSHWLAEVAAVLTRLEPRVAKEALPLLYALEFPVSGGLEVYQRACSLAVTFSQHVFDTLYHAVALTEPEAMLITADERYYRKAAKAGRIVRLRDYRPVLLGSES